MYRPRHPPTVGRVAAPTLRVISAVHFYHIAAGVLNHIGAGYQAGVAKPHLTPRRQAVKPPRRVFHKVIPLYVHFPAERHAANPHAGILRVVDGLKLIARPLRVVGDDHFQRAQHGHAPRRPPVQVFPQAGFQQRQFGNGVAPRYAHPLAHIPYGLRRIAPPPQPADGGHPRIIPPGYIAVLHQLPQHPLAHHRMAEVQPRELNLPAAVDPQRFLAPVIQRPVVFKLQSAQRMGNSLNGIRQRMRVVVHRIDAPVTPRPVMRRVANAVQRRIPHIEVGRSHINARAQHISAVGKLPGPHPPEQVQAFRRRAVAMRTFLPRLRQRPPIGAHFLRRQAVHISVAVPDQLLGVLIQLLKVIRGVIQMLAPVEPQPPNIRQDGLHILNILPRRVGVIKPHVAARPRVLLAHAKIEADGLGVPNVQVAVRFRRKARHHPPVVSPGGPVFIDNAADKINGDFPGRVSSHFPAGLRYRIRWVQRSALSNYSLSRLSWLGGRPRARTRRFRRRWRRFTRAGKVARETGAAPFGFVA